MSKLTMPYVNGNFHRSAGKGYATEKAKAAQGGGQAKHDEVHENPGGEDKKEGHGSVVHIKHHGGGKFSVKHEDGQVSKHDSAEDMHQHLDQHFGVEEPSPEEPGYEDGEEMGEGSSLKSILG